MLTSDGYCLNYHKSRNQIVISLPQTYATITNTVEQPVDRRTDVQETDLAVLLNIAKLIFHKGERNYDDICYECRGYGDDYYFDDDGELVSACSDCWVTKEKNAETD